MMKKERKQEAICKELVNLNPSKFLPHWEDLKAWKAKLFEIHSMHTNWDFNLFSFLCSNASIIDSVVDFSYKLF